MLFLIQKRHTYKLRIYIFYLYNIKYMSDSNFSIKADTLFLIIIGKYDAMNDLINTLNKSCVNEKFILTKINYPSANKSIELMKELNNIDDTNLLDSYVQRSVLIDDGVEFAQGHIYADGKYNDDHYILQVLIDNDTHYMLSFLKFALNEDDNPESIIEDWFKKKLGKIPSSVKKSVKLITVAGSKFNILVISVELKKSIN